MREGQSRIFGERRQTRFLSCVVAAVAVAGVPAATAAPADAGARPACQGPASLGNSLGLPGSRKISVRGVACKPALKVVAAYAKRCLAAYSAQDACGFSSGGRWRCDSRIVGTALAGAPSAVTCTRPRARVGFTVAISLSLPVAHVHPSEQASARTAAGPLHSNCIDGGVAAQVVPPAGPPNDTFEIRTYGSVPLSFGRAVQQSLISHGVTARLQNGLGVLPRGYPGRVPIYLVPGNQVEAGADGDTNDLCGGSRNQGSVVAAGGGAEYAASVVAHELFHVYSDAVKRTSAYPWFDDMAADWSVVKAGYNPGSGTDVFLQYPNNALDSLNPAPYRYAMWRFVQFLDDKGLIVAGDGSWPLVRGVVAGHPAEAATWDQILVSMGSSLGRELAAFWGEHLKESPSRPPQVEPSPPLNSRAFTARTGRKTFTINAARLHTSLTDFKLARDVKRVEFEFEPPADGYFWGLVAPNESRQFNSQDSVSFCVGGADADDLKWPGHLPVTFTNGLVPDTGLSGQITVFAQTNTDQCTNPEVNRACKVMSASRADDVLGPSPLGGFKGSSGVERGRPYDLCVYTGRNGVGTFQIERWSSSKELRRAIVNSAKRAGWTRLDLGDVAAFQQAPGGRIATVSIAIGHDKLDIFVSGRGGAGGVVRRLAPPAIRLVR